MNTMWAEYRTDIARLAEYMAKRDVDAANRAAERDAEAVNREKRMLLWMISVITLATTIIFGALGLMSGILPSV